MTGSQFERVIVRAMGDCGYWAHRIAPDARGAQPFDVIAVGNGNVVAADCKVCQNGRFPFSRLEDNQMFSFEHMLQMNKDASNVFAGILALYDNKVYWIEYQFILKAIAQGKKSLNVKEVGAECKLLSDAILS